MITNKSIHSFFLRFIIWNKSICIDNLIDEPSTVNFFLTGNNIYLRKMWRRRDAPHHICLATPSLRFSCFQCINLWSYLPDSIFSPLLLQWMENKIIGISLYCNGISVISIGIKFVKICCIAMKSMIDIDNTIVGVEITKL